MKLELNSYSEIENALNTVAFLKVVSVTDIGAFLATGCDKDLFLPFSEQTDPVEINDEVIVYVYLDNNERPCSSMRIENHINRVATPDVVKAAFVVDQEAELIIYDETDLGYKALVDRSALGLLYKNEVFQKIYYADLVKGFVKKVRPDGKLDIILRAHGHEATDDIAIRILELLKESNNHLNVTDKTSPEEIYRLFQASKKKFKIALGRLYKQRVITVGEDGIRGCKPS